MNWVMIVILFLHGAIHSFGFFKGFGIFEFENITKDVSKLYGLIWLFASLTFIGSAILLLVNNNNWWLLCLVSIIASQFLIFNYWNDTKFATIINFILLVVVFISYSTQSFKNMGSDEINTLYSEQVNSEQDWNNEERYSNLPEPIKKWLERSGADKANNIESVYLEQNIEMKLSPEQKDWTLAEAQQHFTTNPPAFIWSVDLTMYGVANVVGRDKFYNGKGEMLIKLLSIIPVANAKESSKTDQASLQRYLAEIVWFPTAALSKYITWESIDSRSAKATLEYNGTSGSGIFLFDENGDFKSFTADRYKDVEDKEPKKWIVNANRIEERNGIRIPVECEVKWELDKGDWTWLKLEISEIEYNKKTEKKN
jgi:hypothetical protein